MIVPTEASTPAWGGDTRGGRLEQVMKFWEEPVVVRSADGHQFSVGVVAAGMGTSPYFGGLWLAVFGLPWYLVARHRNRAWRVEVTEAEERRAALRSWRPRPYVTVVAECSTRESAMYEADSLATRLRPDGVKVLG
jgi:hypothetical protein